jgi:membrane associated rhomboid family serine protease
MTEAAAVHPLEGFLRLIADAAPEPWYPRVYAQTKRIPLESINYYLEHLWLDGLLEKGAGTAETGAGLLLSPKGAELLRDPDGMRRLRGGLPVTPGDRGGIIRQCVRRQPRPIVTRLLLLANFAVFGYGIYLARPDKVNAYLSGTLFSKDPAQILAVQGLLTRLGAVNAITLIHGEWWRLLATCFVHIGVLHLLMNMYMLYKAGPFIEQMWGPTRYLIIYLLSGLGGSCLSVAHQVAGGAGASGALCGILAAEAVWALLNRKYLPRGVVRTFRGNFIMAVIMIAFISSFPGVDAWGHFGGAIVGAGVAFFLNWQRFGPNPWRWLAVLPLLPLPWVGYVVIERARQNDPAWQEVEVKAFENSFKDFPVIMNASREVYQKELRPLLDRHAQRRDPAAVRAALDKLGGPLTNLKQLANRLSAAGPYRNPTVEEARQKALAFVEANTTWIEMARHCLEEGEGCTNKEEKALKEQEETVNERMREWRALLGN